MSGVVHVVAFVDDDSRAVALARALHDPGRPHLVLAGQASDEVARALGTRLRVVAGLVAPPGARPLRDALTLVELTRILDGLVDRLRSPVVVQTYDGDARSTRASVLGRFAANALRGVVNVHDAHDRRGDGTVDVWGGDVVVYASERDQARLRRGTTDNVRRVRIIADGIDVAPLAALIGDDARRMRTRASLGVAASARLVVVHDTRTRAVDALAAWRSRARFGDVLQLPPDFAAASSLSTRFPHGIDLLCAADAALLVLPSLREVLVCAAAGLAVVVIGRTHAAELSWAKRVAFLNDDATSEDIAAALARVVGGRTLAASTRKAHARLPRELTMAGALATWSELYDDLVGPPRPTGEVARRRPRRRR